MSENLNDKVSFWKTDEGKILSYGIHEHTNANAIMGAHINLILKKPDEFSKEKIIDILVKFKETHLKRSNDAMDYIYTEMKKLKGY